MGAAPLCSCWANSVQLVTLPLLDGQALALIHMTGPFIAKMNMVGHYFQRVDPQLLGSQGRNFQEMEQQGADWHWLIDKDLLEVHSPDELISQIAAMAFGLAIWRLKDSNAGKVAMLEHISVAGDMQHLAPALDSCRLWFSESLDCDAMKVVVWCEEAAAPLSNGAEPSLVLNKRVEQYFKAQHFRWDRLTNIPGGGRVQIMRRSLAKQDEEAAQQMVLAKPSHELVPSEDILCRLSLLVDSLSCTTPSRCF
mmetsp:Transcript_130369/g.260051  ORF Transcript_130369/g.260051 Transcript_130369/m.260051 type:complete len:252 (-) Transcript_130369:22-777(-)